MQARETEAGVLGGAGAILLVGLALGAGYNWMGVEGGWGLPWIGQDRLAQAPTVEAVSSGSSYGGISDPMAVGSPAAGLPEIPALGRPVQIEMAALAQLYEARAALIVDAREPDEFGLGHIPGAVNLPYDEVSSQPERLVDLDPGGRPIVVYCGGGGCEVSTSLAYDLVEAGHDRVAVYVGGFPEWEAAGRPVARRGAQG
jgi:rhodanese-related sulfurtransferase